MSSAEILLRPPIEGDVPALLDYFDAIQTERGEGGRSEARVRDELARGPEKLRLALRDGRIAGFASIWHPEEGSFRVFLELKIHPEDMKVAACLIDWAEKQGRHFTRGAEGPVIRADALSDQEALQELYCKRDYRLIRHFFTMEIDLTAEPSEPVWPDGIEVRTFRPEDARRVYEADLDAFRDHWDSFDIPYGEFKAYFIDASDFDPELLFLAEDGDDLVGFSICRSENKPGVGHVAVLGVRRPWRRRGLGTALLLQSFRALRRRGRAKADLGVDAENPTGAVRMYERAGMHVARRYDIYQKEL